MSNEFDPKLKAQLHERRRERLRALNRERNKAALRRYLDQRGLTSIDQDPTLVIKKQTPE